MQKSCPHTFKVWGAWSSGCFQSRQLTCVTCGDNLDSESREDHDMRQAADVNRAGQVYRYLKCSRCGKT